ncbi:hypothetical protein PENSPDRAFT_652831 [Peniophora sp. CONT]|nr:hypothetical protein PENSPDRAFT_652831 [Peniophora sp. CONT]
MPVWDKDIKASKLLVPVMARQRQIIIKLNSEVDADAIYNEELEKNIKRGLTVSRASRHAAEKVMRVVDGLVAAKVEEINAIERRKAEVQEHLRMFEGEVFPASHVRRVGPFREPHLNTNVPRQRHARTSCGRQEPVASTSRASAQLR